LSFPINFGGKKKIEIEEEEHVNEQPDDSQLFKNPIMRSFIKLHNELEGLTHEDPSNVYYEVSLKIKICDIIENFLDMR